MPYTTNPCPRCLVALWPLFLALAAYAYGATVQPGADGHSAVLSPPADAAQINPLTALVQSHGTRTGASQAEAEQALARQLGIDVAQLRDHRQQTEVTFAGLDGIADNARTAAALLEQGLQRGAAPLLRVGSDVLDESPRLMALNFQDQVNYDFYVESTDGITNAAGQLLWDPVYGGLIRGNPRTPYDASLCYEAVNGFRYTGREEYLRNRGNPARIEIASRNKIAPRIRLLLGMTQPPEPLAALFEITLENTDISHRSMADFVRQVQALEREPGSLVHQSLFTMDPQALGAATFPPGSRWHVQLQTHFAKAGVEKSAPEFHCTLRCARDNDLPKPAATLAAFGKPLRVKHTINATAWDAMKAALDIP